MNFADNSAKQLGGQVCPPRDGICILLEKTRNELMNANTMADKILNLLVGNQKENVAERSPSPVSNMADHAVELSELSSALSYKLNRIFGSFG